MLCIGEALFEIPLEGGETCYLYSIKVLGWRGISSSLVDVVLRGCCGLCFFVMMVVGRGVVKLSTVGVIGMFNLMDAVGETVVMDR